VAATTLVAIDYRADKTIPVPDEWRERIEAYEAKSFATA
jgi:acyl-CoA thioesterase FadM